MLHTYFHTFVEALKCSPKLILGSAGDLGDLVKFEYFRQRIVYRTLGISVSFPLLLQQYQEMNLQFLEFL